MILNGKYIILYNKDMEFILNFLYREGYYWNENNDKEKNDMIPHLIKHCNVIVLHSYNNGPQLTYFSQIYNIGIFAKGESELNVNVLYREDKLKRILK